MSRVDIWGRPVEDEFQDRMRKTPDCPLVQGIGLSFLGTRLPSALRHRETWRAPSLEPSKFLYVPNQVSAPFFAGTPCFGSFEGKPKREKMENSLFQGTPLFWGGP